MRMFRVATEIPRIRVVDRNTPVIYHHRITDTQTTSRTTGMPSNKEYNVYVYRYPDRQCGVIAYYGRIGSSMKTDWKGGGPAHFALNIAGGIISRELRNPNKNYRSSQAINTSIPGIITPQVPSTTPANVRQVLPRYQRPPQPQHNEPPLPEVPQVKEPAEPPPEPPPSQVALQKEVKKEEPKPFQDKNDPLWEILGMKKFMLLKKAQGIRGPGGREDWSHGTYGQAEQLLRAGHPVPAGVSSTRAFIWKVVRRGNQWVVVKSNKIEGNELAGLEIQGIGGLAMNEIGRFNTQDEAIHFVVGSPDGEVGDIQREEDTVAREKREKEEAEERAKREVKEKEKQEKVKKMYGNPEVKQEEEKVKIDPRLDEILGTRKNWYKKACEK